MTHLYDILEIANKGAVEIELLNGNRVLFPKSSSKIYNIKEKSRWCIEFQREFPFFRFKKQRYVSFKFRTHYETLDDFFDPTFKVNCTLIQFASIFNIKILPFEQALIENDLNYGNASS